jgi:hypothetical protein
LKALRAKYREDAGHIAVEFVTPRKVEFNRFNLALTGYVLLTKRRN